ncbi:hypothetical protein NW761_014738 [Fusarium oxysporum]|uniref:Uncharacterized protein n=2 Tax=Fusarium oxysporum TaxID=5507 RepID=A0A2H3T1R3_FUSOX|nr:hypothetical protein FOVG_16354 [Fusarium oxysporum f. sp. pisi HDV247]KAJ4023769.1 hypothetical protein NW758_014676 [Fusarium oxysporum]WKT43829.1 hypothetical protein QSH57_008682 [Fusarium oxysporum f. sp. vasinfectum]KAJ4072632.1 hypothetical protein NW761_014738 [Fusarium oxysporum]KAJ4079036.1 hypothetical protein NW769_015128 [Fusarium oxysporum]
MKFLGIRRLRVCDTNSPMLENILADLKWEEEECAEMLEEDQILIDQLHALDGMFDEEFQRQNVSIADSLQGYWLERMEEIGNEMDMPLSDDYRHDLRQVGMVLEEDGESGLGSEEK